MNKGLIAVLSFVAGALAGSAGVYYYTKKQYDEKMNKETKEIKEYYDRKFQIALDDFQGHVALFAKEETDSLVNELEEKKKAKKVKAEKTVEDDVADEVDRAKEEYDNIVKTDYNAISAKKKTTKKKKKVEEEVPEGPYLISYDEYAADRKRYKRIVTYLDQEDMVIDEAFEPAEDGFDWLGRENIENLELSNDEDAVYVRNDAMGADFMVVINVTDTYDEFLQKSV